jgi:hypothetical protein
MDRRVIRDWFFFLLFLVVFPADSRVAAEIKPEDWYGELQIPVANRLVVVGKNSTESVVNLGLKDLKSAYAIQSDRAEGLAYADLSGGLPNGIVVAEAPRWINHSGRWVNIDGKHYFTPGSLVILTKADLYTAYVAAALIAVLFMVLGFVIAQFSTDENVRLAGEVRSRKVRMR